MTELADISVLVVDPNRNMRKILMSLLRSAGIYNITRRQDGADALRLHRIRAYDVLITEWTMPGLHGRDLVTAIRRDISSDRNKIPILVLSADSNHTTVLAARDAGAHAYLLKPVSSKTLSRRIDDIVNRSRPFVDRKNYIGPDRRFFVEPDYSGEERRNNLGNAVAG